MIEFEHEPLMKVKVNQEMVTYPADDRFAVVRSSGYDSQINQWPPQS